MKRYHALFVGLGLGTFFYLLYKNYRGSNSSNSMGGVDFGVLDPTQGWDSQ